MSDSPCTGVCELADGVCVGCGRTTAEIRRWPALPPAERRAVRERLGTDETPTEGPSADD